VLTVEDRSPLSSVCSNPARLLDGIDIAKAQHVAPIRVAREHFPRGRGPIPLVGPGRTRRRSGWICRASRGSLAGILADTVLSYSG
jgi:hypothetical protein